MLKKYVAAAGIAAAFLFVGAGAASAAAYPADVPIVAEDTTPGVGVPTLLTVTGLGALDDVTFSASGCASATFEESGSATATVPVVDESASATFVATAAGTCTVSVLDGDTVIGSTVLTVGTPASSGGGTGGLPPTGGDVPAAAIWLGVGALAVGGIAVAAAAARRRSHVKR